MKRTLSALLVLALSPLAAGQDCVGPLDATTVKLTAPAAAFGDVFGNAVAIQGDVAVIGAAGRNTAGIDAGSAFVYRRTAGVWSFEAELTASDAAAGAAFGSAVALDGDVVVVGAVFDDDAGPDTGGAYVFRHAGGASWPQEAKLTAPNAAAGDQFGISVDVDGDVAVVGANAKASNTGEAYAYRFDGANWIDEAIVLGAVPPVGSFYGVDVTASGDAIAVGAGEGGMPPLDTGRVYVYRYDGAAWQEEQVIDSAQSVLNDRFGRAVDMEGATLLIGAPNATVGMGTPNTGSAFVYRFDGVTWNEEQEILARIPATGEAFGSSVSLSGELALVGAGLHDPEAGSTDTGAAHVFRYIPPAGTWVQVQRLLASDREPNDALGFVGAVGIDGTDVLVGASLDDDACPAFVTCDSGSAYTHVVPDVALDIAPEPLVTNNPGTLDNCGGVPGNVFLTLLVDVNGVPVNQQVVLTTYSSGGDRGFSQSVPSGAAGNTVTLRTYTINAAGQVVASNDETVDIV